MGNYLPPLYNVAKAYQQQNEQMLKSLLHQTQSGLRFNEQMSQRFTSTIQPMLDQMKVHTTLLESIRDNMPTYKLQTEILNGMNEQIRQINKQLQHPTYQALQEISIASNVMSQIDMRNIIYNVSNINVDDEISEEEKNTLKEYTKSVISFSPIAAQETVGIVVWTITAYQIMNDPTLMTLFFNILTYIHNSNMLIKDIEDED